MALRMSDNLKKEVNNKSRLIYGKGLGPKKYESDNEYFEAALDLDDKEVVFKSFSKDEIDEYLSIVVSGERYGFQKGLPYSGGIMIVSFETLKEMVDKGDNIIRAKCLDDNGKIISIEYESYGNIENNKQGRGR